MIFNVDSATPQIILLAFLVLSKKFQISLKSTFVTISLYQSFDTSMEKSQKQKIVTLLKLKRNQLAEQFHIEPYKILHNETIELIAEKQPKNVQELFGIKGIGEKKIMRYGALILQVIQSVTNGSGIIEGENDDGHKNDEGDTKVYTVLEYLEGLNVFLRQKRALVEGEIVDEITKRGSAVYFTLRDESQDAVMKCFMWAWELDRVGIELYEGMVIRVDGYTEIWAPSGRMNFQVKNILLTREGELKKAFEFLKRKLEDEGLFDVSRKKPLAPFIKNIGLITSKGREAQTDFLTHLSKCALRVYLYDVRVEGSQAIDQITSAISWFNQFMPHLDVLVLTRGGGSLESLQAFNSEAVARSLISSKIPTLSAIGHERDVTISDFVADVRGSTPTHAAKIISVSWENAQSELSQRQMMIKNSLAQRMMQTSYSLDAQKQNISVSFQNILNDFSAQCDTFSENFRYIIQRIFDDFHRIHLVFRTNFRILQQKWSQLQTLSQNQKSHLASRWFWYIHVLKMRITDEQKKLKLVDPELKLKQGYSIVTLEPGNKIITSSRSLAKGDALNIKFHEGKAKTVIEDVS